MNAIRITKYTGSGSLVLKNLCLTKIIKNRISTEKFSLNEIPGVIEENFGIPLGVVEKAIINIKELNRITSYNVCYTKLLRFFVE